MEHPGKLESLLQLEEHADLFGRAVEAEPALATFIVPKDGRTVIEAAYPKVREAMEAALYLLKRFEVSTGPPLHFSATAAVLAATDHGVEAKPRRALKAMKEASQVLAELEGRKGLDPSFVVAVVGLFVDDQVEDATFNELEGGRYKARGVTVERAAGLSARSPRSSRCAAAVVAPHRTPQSLDARTQGYRFLLVLKLADRGLDDAMRHDYIAGENFPLIRSIATDLANALDHLHEKGRIHADLKPLNAVCVGSAWQLIDLDVSCPIGKAFGKKVPSSGYCPPEMAKVLLDATNKETGVVDTSQLATLTMRRASRTICGRLASCSSTLSSAALSGACT